MTISIVRALRGPLVVGLLAFSAMAVLAAAGYSPEERKLVDKLPQLFQAKCLEGATKAQLEHPQEDKALSGPLMDAMRGPNGTCACVSSEVMRHMTPEVLHRPDIEQFMSGLTADAGATCMARMVRSVFPTVCPAVLRKVMAKHTSGMDTDGTTYIPGMCQCVQRRMDALSPTDLRPYIQALMAPANRDRSSRDVALQTLPPAFATDLRECGVAAANRMVDAETAAANAVAATAPAAPASTPAP
jgi:hypothetical protein